MCGADLDASYHFPLHALFSNRPPTHHPQNLHTHTFYSVHIMVHNIPQVASPNFLLFNYDIKYLVEMPPPVFTPMPFITFTVKNVSHSVKWVGVYSLMRKVMLTEVGARIDISDLIIHFVSLIKSLCIRGYSKTLWLFLDYIY